MLCIRPVCDVSLCSHSVPSGGFNSLLDTQARVIEIMGRTVPSFRIAVRIQSKETFKHIKKHV